MGNWKPGKLTGEVCTALCCVCRGGDVKVVSLVLGDRGGGHMPIPMPMPILYSPKGLGGWGWGWCIMGMGICGLWW